jgi:hypothetical protein
LIAGVLEEHSNVRTIGNETLIMRILCIYIILFSLVFFNLSKASCMVLPRTDSELSVDENYAERFELVTDRNIYAVGEKIHFKAFNTSPPIVKTACWSKVLYVQLLRQDGTAVAKGKFKLSCEGSHGYLMVPEQLLTGNYYLTVYTKWMRNFSPLHFDLRPIKIINPYTIKLDKFSPSDSILMNHETKKEVPGVIENTIVCSTDKSQYLQGEQVHCTIRLPEMPGSGECRLTIVACRPGATDTLPPLALIPGSEVYDDTYQASFLPEIRGLSLSGKIISKSSSEPIEGAHVELSILGKHHRFHSFTTKQGGRFYFALDSITGEHELFIAANHDQHPDLDILIDREFVDLPGGISNKPFELSASERKLAEEIMINMQAERIYTIPGPVIDMNASANKGRQAFYDIPLTPLLIDDFIELPTLKEVFIELVPEVLPRERKGEPYLIFSGNEMTSRLIEDFEPLILLDQLPVYNLEKFLSISPARIHSIEIVNEIYVLGSNQYGGVINIVSKKGDMAGIDLPDNSFFFTFSGFLPLENPAKPENNIEDSDLPDFRNSLTWKPDIVVRPGQTKTISFTTSDRIGRYMILIRGFTAEGEPIQTTSYFEVE